MRKYIVILLAFAVTCAGTYAWGEQQKVYVYPEKNQSKAKQEKDEFECHKWAVEQSGVDPYEGAKPNTGEQVVIGTLAGAAIGAASGAAIGAITGDAGTGAAIGATAGGCGGAMHGAEHAQRMKEVNYDNYLRAFAACMEAKNYTVR
jgi:hypothetical protein